MKTVGPYIALPEHEMYRNRCIRTRMPLSEPPFPSHRASPVKQSPRTFPPHQLRVALSVIHSRNVGKMSVGLEGRKEIVDGDC